MRRLGQLVSRFKQLTGIVSSSEAEYLQHLNETISLIRHDREHLLEWIDTSINRNEFLAQKYRAEEDVIYYTQRIAVLKRLRKYLDLILTPDKLN